MDSNGMISSMFLSFFLSFSLSLSLDIHLMLQRKCSVMKIRTAHKNTPAC
jgi:hypothetical protein